MINIPETTEFTIALTIVFSTGFLSGLSPCSLPTVLLVAGFTGKEARISRKYGIYTALAFVAGIIMFLTLLGALAGSFGLLITNSRFFDYGMATIMVFMGLWLLKIIDLDNNKAWNWISPKRGSGIFGAFLLGIPFAVAASPCTLPVTVSVLTYSAKIASPVSGALLLACFALGRSLPLIIVGSFSTLLTQFKKITPFQVWFERIAGIVLIIIAGFLVWNS